MTAWNFAKGLQETGSGIYSYLQPDGSWGWSNAGLIVDGDASLLVDTLFDAPLTRDMLKVMQDATGISPEQIDRKSTRLNSSHSQQSRMPSSA